LNAEGVVRFRSKQDEAIQTGSVIPRPFRNLLRRPCFEGGCGGGTSDPFRERVNAYEVYNSGLNMQEMRRKGREKKKDTAACPIQGQNERVDVIARVQKKAYPIDPTQKAGGYKLPFAVS